VLFRRSERCPFEAADGGLVGAERNLAHWLSFRSATTVREQAVASGFNQEAIDKAAREGMANGAFEESAEEGGAVVEEFFRDAAEPRTDSEPPKAAPGLAEKLRRKLAPELPTAGGPHATSST
jgi:hypothetical protein